MISLPASAAVLALCVLLILIVGTFNNLRD
jgi:hypothetical protein